MRKVIDAAKKRVIPSAAEQKLKSEIAEYTLNLVHEKISGHDEIRGAELGGSFAKGTWLAGADIDVFVVFDTRVAAKRLESIARKIGFNAMRKHSPYVRYASHPYVEAIVRGTKINIVPCYDVTPGHWKSAADRSRFHTLFMHEALTASMRNDVRVLKRMLQSNGLYGAEIARQAISGYACEALVHTYGTLPNMIRRIGAADDGLTVGKSRIESKTRIAIMDPIDPTRNLATAVSEQNMGNFVMLCHAFAARASSSMIFSAPRLRTHPGVLKNTLVVEFDASERSPETIWGQAKKASATLALRLETGGFDVIRHGAHVSDSMHVTLAFVLASLSAPDWSVGMGPEYFGAKHASQFAHKNAHSPMVWLSADSRLYSLRPHDHTKAQDALRALLGPGLGRSGIPQGLLRDIRAGFTIKAGLRASNRTILRRISDIVSTNTRAFS